MNRGKVWNARRVSKQIERIIFFKSIDIENEVEKKTIAQNEIDKRMRIV